MGGLDLTRFFVTGGFWDCSGDLVLSGLSISHLERFLEGVDGPACWDSSVDMVDESRKEYGSDRNRA